MLKGRRRAARGAAALVLLGSMGTVLTGAVAAVDAAAAVNAQAHAENAADAVAHGTGVALLRDADEEALSIAVQAGTACDTGAGDGSEPACRRAIQAARDIAAANRAVLAFLFVGPDPRDMRDGHAGGRFLVEAHVFAPRGLPISPGSCPRRPGSGPDLCWVDAWSAAQDAG